MACVRLLQDEDEDIRHEATLSLQFINKSFTQDEKPSKTTHSMTQQANLTLQNLFQLFKNFSDNKFIFLRWLGQVLCVDDEAVDVENR